MAHCLARVDDHVEHVLDQVAVGVADHEQRVGRLRTILYNSRNDIKHLQVLEKRKR